MKFKLLLICFVFLTFNLFGQTGRVKRAIKALDKEKIEKAEKLLYKSLSKDSVNAGAHYGLSLLLVSELYSSYNIDSAYYHVNMAIAQFDSLTAGDKQRKRLQKIGVVDTTLLNQKALIEELAFQHVNRTHTIEAYNYFLNHYSGASQVAEAIRIRNEIAYNQALAENTYDAYKHFLDTYPDATQIAEASELYEFLLYENKTKSRTLSSYMSFLKEHPNTNYTNDALENIFELYTIDHKPDSYIKYIKDFPQGGKFKKKAIDFLFHQVKHKKGASFFKEKYESYMSDSLLQIIDLDQNSIFPIVENGFYGFKNNHGHIVISPQYDEIDEEYLCGDIPEDYVVARKGVSDLLISHAGDIIFEELSGTVSSLGHGLLQTQKNGKYSALHLAGYEVTATVYDTLTILDDQYLKYGLGEKWGLLSFSGRKITSPEFDDIFIEGDFIVFEKNEKLAFANDQLLFAFANEGSHPLRFIYDDYELLNNNDLLAFRNDNQTVINKNLETVIPEKNHDIVQLSEGWLIREEEKFRFYSEDMLPMSNEGYDAAHFTDGWLALKRDDKWALIDQGKNVFPEFVYDTLQLPGNYFALGTKSDSTFVIFKKGERKLLPKKADYKVVKANNHLGKPGAEIFVVNNSNNYKTIYNQSGRQIINGRYDDVSMLGINYIILERYKRKGLADTTGNMLLPVTYDGLGNHAEDDINILKNQKFGLFNQKKGIDINPQYDVILKPYNDSIYIASKGRNLGLVDKSNKEVLPFEFDDIKLWNDSLALVKYADQWKIFNLNTKLPVLEEISNIKFLEQANKTAVQQAIIYKNNAYGVITSENLAFLPPVYDDIFILGKTENPIFFAEKRVKEAGLYVVIYYNGEGDTVHQQTFSEEQYDLIYCY